MTFTTAHLEDITNEIIALKAFSLR